MLSRVADALYWMSRYMERAEDITRFLTVNFHTLLDLPGQDMTLSWQPIVRVTGDEDLYAQVFGTDYTTRNVMEFLLWHPANPNAVIRCITLARENARTVREQISSEMWEQINKLYFLMREMPRNAILRGPHDFFGQVRDGSHAFQGVTHATMTHGDGYSFIQLGKHIERADKTARILDVKYAALGQMDEGSTGAQMQLMAMLRSCSAMESYRKVAQQLQTWRVVEFLLLNKQFPRSVRFCLKSCLEAVDSIVGFEDVSRNGQQNGPARLFGRLCADLDYLDIRDVLGAGVHQYLDRLAGRLNLAGDEITTAYFNMQVILPGTKRTVQQVQQQQQQQQQSKATE
jgi:uncharacterized alpha-E superfamily protein